MPGPSPSEAESKMLRHLLDRLEVQPVLTHMHTQSCLTLCNPIDGSHRAPLSMEFSRQEYWSELPVPIPGDLPDPGIEPAIWQVDSLPLAAPGKSLYWFN